MAKNKSKKKVHQTQKLSPERYLREKVRQLPIGKCYITPDWQKNGIASIIISRCRPDGKLATGAFLVDTFCVGVKDAIYRTDLTEDEFNKIKRHYSREKDLEEISYNEAHNIIYGAIEFAAEGGIKPANDFRIAQYILEEDTDSIPLIEYEFGKDGKHFLIIHSNHREMPYFHQLKKTLGNDFHYILPADEFFDEFEDEEDYEDDYSEDDFEIPDGVKKTDFAKQLLKAMENMKKTAAESNRHPDEVYAYNYPEYPQTLTVKNQFIADELLSKDNNYGLPDSAIEQILALPADEAVEDICNIALYEIGRTYKAINDKTIGKFENAALIHAILLLTQFRSEKGLDTVLEIMRQHGNFADYHFGDIAPEIIHQALYACGQNNVLAIEAYIYQPGLDNYLKQQAFEALIMVVKQQPERRTEIIELFRKLMKSWITRLPEQYGCDGCLAGFLMSSMIDLEAEELIPEIKEVFATDCVDKTIAGDCDEVIDHILNEKDHYDRENFEFPDIHRQYAHLRSFKPSE